MIADTEDAAVADLSAAADAAVAEMAERAGLVPEQKNAPEPEAPRRGRRSKDDVPDITAVRTNHTAKIVRDWVRSTLLPDIVKRAYLIGMGEVEFQTPTQAGNVVLIEAPPAVQVNAQKLIVSIGIPGQLGLVDDNGDSLPGVFALGALDLDAARREVHGERYIPPEQHARLVAEVHGADAVPVQDPATRPMDERIANGEFEVVEVEEGVGVAKASDGDAPPVILPPDPESPAQAALRRHRERMARKRPKA